MGFLRVAAIALPIMTAVGLAMPAAAQSPDQHYRGGNTGDLVALCAANETDPGGERARAWCYGFIVGAAQYHSDLAAADPGHERLFCMPDPAPSLDQARSDFVAWGQANPQYNDSKAIDGLMRFAGSQYPCPPSPTPARRRR